MNGGESIAWRVVFAVGAVILGAPAYHFFKKGIRARERPVQVAHIAISILLFAALAALVLYMFGSFA